MVKRFIIAAILLALVGGGFVGFNLFRDQAIQEFFANQQRPPVTVSTYTVEPVSWRPTIEAIGTVSATRGVDLTVETAGVVDEIAFRSNEEVEKGQLLLHLKDEVEHADLLAAEAEARLKRQTLERTQTLGERGISAKASLDTAIAEASAADSRVGRLKAVLEQKRLVAPFAGTIGIPQVDLGEYVTPGTVVATLQGLDQMRVDFTVPEQALPNLKMGQTVRLGPDVDRLVYEGAITGIDPKIDPATRLVSIRAEINNTDGSLTPGQFVQVRVELPEEKNILAIPQTALVASLYGDYVYVVKEAEAQGEGSAEPEGEGSAEPKLVVEQVFAKAGRRSRGMVEIVEGLEAGDRVVSAGQNRLSGGAPVTIAEEVATPAAEASTIQ